MTATSDRIARYATKYLAAHPGADPADPAVIREINKGGRGHIHTPEHGSSVPIEYSSRTVYVTNSAQEAKRLINHAAAQGQRVSVAINDKNNPVVPREVWTNKAPVDFRHGRGFPKPGMSAKYVKEHVGAQNVKRYLEGTTFGGGKYKQAAYTPSGVTALQVTVYH